MEKKRKYDYIETAAIGVVDALTSIFAQSCRNGIIGGISSIRQVAEYGGINPTMALKFSMAIAGLMESYNVVYANCDFTN